MGRVPWPIGQIREGPGSGPAITFSTPSRSRQIETPNYVNDGIHGPDFGKCTWVHIAPNEHAPRPRRASQTPEMLLRMNSLRQRAGLQHFGDVPESPLALAAGDGYGHVRCGNAAFCSHAAR